jgi:hypothetical protein
MGRIYKIGLEIEGGWEGKAGLPPFDIPIIADHSIDGRTVLSNNPLTCPHVGEVVSKPMLPDLATIETFLDKYWPQYSNNTCGYHIHLSTKSMRDYSILTTKTFLYSLVKALQEKATSLQLPPNHLIFSRLKGANPFAVLNFDASNQIRLKQKSIGNTLRYSILNYSWNLHGTVELRVLPTFDKVSLAKEFTFFYLDFVEEALANSTINFSTPYSAVLREQYGEVLYSLYTPNLGEVK